MLYRRHPLTRRELAAEYSREAKRMGSQWPRTATILRTLADSYEMEARKEDEEAKCFHSGLE